MAFWNALSALAPVAPALSDARDLAQQRQRDFAAAGKTHRLHALDIDAAFFQRHQHGNVIVAGDTGAAEGQCVGRFAQPRQQFAGRAQRRIRPHVDAVVLIHHQRQRREIGVTVRRQSRDVRAQRDAVHDQQHVAIACAGA